MKNKIVLTGRIPSKKNSKIIICRGSKPMLLPSQKHKEWHEEAMTQLIGKQIIESDTIKATFYAPDKRRADLSNKFESVADLLVDAGLIEDDNWFVLKDIRLVFGGVDKENPRVELDF